MQSRDARCFSGLKCDACGQTDRWRLRDVYRHVPLIAALINVSLLYRNVTSTYLCCSYGALYCYVTPNKYRKSAPLKGKSPRLNVRMANQELKSNNTVSNIYICLLRSVFCKYVMFIAFHFHIQAFVIPELYNKELHNCERTIGAPITRGKNEKDSVV
jgi:hypothetical protein